MEEGASAHGPRALLISIFLCVAGRKKGPQKPQGHKSKITLLQKARLQK